MCQVCEKQMNAVHGCLAIILWVGKKNKNKCKNTQWLFQVWKKTNTRIIYTWHTSNLFNLFKSLAPGYFSKLQPHVFYWKHMIFWKFYHKGLFNLAVTRYLQPDIHTSYDTFVLIQYKGIIICMYIWFILWYTTEQELHSHLFHKKTCANAQAIILNR